MNRLRNGCLKYLRSARGFATSLMEATATVSVGAILAGVAIGSAIDAINDSKIQAAVADLQSIGQGVVTFYKDNYIFPGYRRGNESGPDDDIYEVLVSENGSYPRETPGTNWSITLTASPWADNRHFGEVPLRVHDSIENHLVENMIGEDASNRFTQRGSYLGDPSR